MVLFCMQKLMKYYFDKSFISILVEIWYFCLNDDYKL